MNSAGRILRVFIAEDSAPMLARLVDTINDIDGARVVGSGGDVTAIVAQLAPSQADLIVLDFHLVGGSALDILHACLADLPQAVFAILTSHPSPQYRRACMSAGAHYFFDKNTEMDLVVRLTQDLARRLQVPTVKLDA